MLRSGTATAFVFASFVMAGCSGAPGESTGSGAQAQSDRAGDVMTVVDFDDDSMQLTLVTLDGEIVTAEYGAGTLNLEANLREHPPEPQFPGCKGQTHAWNDQIANGTIGAEGATGQVVTRLQHFADFACEAHVTMDGGATVASFQPIP